MPRRIHVIINPAAGQDRPILGPMNRRFLAAGVDWDVTISHGPGDAYDAARRAVRSGVDAVGVYGGDGTVREVASALRGSGVSLGIFPGGTANVMAVELGIPSDLAEACALVSGETGRIRPVDMGEVNGEPFLLRVGLGLEAEMVEGADREKKDRLGVLAYGLAALESLQNPPLAHYRLLLDGREVITEGLTCMIANVGGMGRLGLSLAPSIDLGDGLLDVIVIRKADVTSLVSVAASVVMGNERAESLEHWQAREIVVEAEPPQTVQVDGELMEASNVVARVLPAALQVIVPAASIQAEGVDPTR